MTKAILCRETLMIRASPSSSWKRVAPSRLTQAKVRLSMAFLTLMVLFSGRIKGLKERLCGARGVREIAGTFD